LENNYRFVNSHRKALLSLAFIIFGILLWYAAIEVLAGTASIAILMACLFTGTLFIIAGLVAMTYKPRAAFGPMSGEGPNRYDPARKALDDKDTVYIEHYLGGFASSETHDGPAESIWKRERS
jgi:hypothetical protein